MTILMNINKKNTMTSITKKFKNFDKYLDEIGVDRIEVKGEWELARFIANRIVCVVYFNKHKEFSFSNETAKKVYDAYCENRIINIQDTKRKSLKQKFRQKLLNRDGNICFYSFKEMKEEEITIEHLIPLSKGGKNNIDNLVLCKEEENFKMANKSLIEKIKYRETNLLTNRR